jgi:fermentation-respiration switch protein FrsA (DUF1100 family)
LRAHFVKRFCKNLWSSRKPGWLSLRILLLLIIGLLALVMFLEDRFIYFPSKYPEGNWDVERLRAGRKGADAPKIEDVWMTAADGVRLHGWYCTPPETDQAASSTGSNQMTLLWFHGNAGNLTHRYPVIENLLEQRMAVFIIDYRGYGRSEGSPAEEGLYRDARAAWDYLARERGISPGRIVIFGDSLGGAVAIELATKIEPAGLIVQSSFTSIKDMASQVMPFLPTFILRTRMDSINKIAGVRCPKLFIHSSSDELVPYRFGLQLFDAASEPKRFYEVKGASHNETDLIGGRAYFDAIGDFVRTCAAGLSYTVMAGISPVSLVPQLFNRGHR